MFSRERIVGILEERGGFNAIKDINGDISSWLEENTDKAVWLKLGNIKAGLIHLLKHKEHFADYDINTNEEIVNLILTTIKNNYYVRFKGAQLYQVKDANGDFLMWLRVVISENEYIITAYPYDRKTIPNWVENKFIELENL